MKALLENVSYLADVKILRNVPSIRVPVMNNNQYHDLNGSGLYERKVKNVLIGLLCFGLFFIGPHFSASSWIVSGLRSVYGAPGDNTPSESARSDFSDQYDKDGDGEVDAPDDPSEEDIADFADEYDQDGDGEIDELDVAEDEDEADQSDIDEKDSQDDLDDRDDERDGDETDEPDDDSGDTRDDRDGRNDVDEGERPDFTSSDNNNRNGGSTPGLKNRLGEMADLSPLSEQEEKSLIGNW